MAAASIPSAARRYFVLGASCPLGESILEYAATLGARAIGISRSRPAGNQDNAHTHEWLQLNLHSPGSLGSLDLRPGDVLVSSAPIWDFAHALAHGTLPPGVVAVAISSASALTKSDSRIPFDAGVARLLVESEGAVLSALRGRVHILRPTLIYGSGKDRSVVRMAETLRRWRAFPVVRGGQGKRSPVHVDDLARVTVHIAEHEPAGRALHVPGGETLPFREMLDRLAEALRLRWRAIRLPEGATEWLARALPTKSSAGQALAAIARTGEDLVVPDEVAHLGVGRRPFVADRRALGLT